MSWQALAWATRAGKDYELNPTTRLVLWAMGNYADPEGNDIYPALATLSDDTGLSENSVRRAIKHLCAIGILTMGDQRAVDRLPKNRRPTVYRFVYQGRKGQGSHAGGASVIPLPDFGVPHESARGANRGATVAPKPVKTKEEPTAPDPDRECKDCNRTLPADQVTTSGHCRDCLTNPERVVPAEDQGTGYARFQAIRDAQRTARRAAELRAEEEKAALKTAMAARG